MNNEFQYMVDFTLPAILPEEFLRLIPNQRTEINRLFREGKIVNYALSLDSSKMWAVVQANSEKEVQDMLESLPLTRFMRIKICLLTFYNTAIKEVPVFSMN